jgi:hypothetical protein
MANLNRINAFVRWNDCINFLASVNNPACLNDSQKTAWLLFMYDSEIQNDYCRKGEKKFKKN